MITRQEAILTAILAEALDCFAGDPRDPAKFHVELRRGRVALVEEQHLWIMQKDIACEHWLHGVRFVGVANGYPDCKRRVIANRIEHLRLTVLVDR